MPETRGVLHIGNGIRRTKEDKFEDNEKQGCTNARDSVSMFGILI